LLSFTFATDADGACDGAAASVGPCARPNKLKSDQPPLGEDCTDDDEGTEGGEDDDGDDDDSTRSPDFIFFSADADSGRETSPGC